MKVKTTPKQQAAVDNVLLGKFKSLKGALMDAGYSQNVARKPRQYVFRSKGVEAYLAKLDEKAKKKFNLALRDLVMEKYLEGLDATKSMRITDEKKGDQYLEVPDHLIRKQFLDRFAEFFGWSWQSPPTAGEPGAQYNFFMFDREQREQMKAKFKEFLIAQRRRHA